MVATKNHTFYIRWVTDLARFVTWLKGVSFGEIISLGECVLPLPLCRVGGKVKSKTSDTRGGVSTTLTPASVSKSRSRSQGEHQTSSDDRITNEWSDHRCWFIRLYLIHPVRSDWWLPGIGSGLPGQPKGESSLWFERYMIFAIRLIFLIYISMISFADLADSNCLWCRRRESSLNHQTRSMAWYRNPIVRDRTDNRPGGSDNRQKSG